MTFIKIKRRHVDPMTFRESFGIQYHPHLGDTVLDELLTSTPAAFAPPPSRLIRSKPATNKPTTCTMTPPLSTPRPPNAQFRPPTPPKAKNKQANSPRTGSPQKLDNKFVLPKCHSSKKLEISLSRILEDTSLTVNGDGSDTFFLDVLTAICKSPAGKKALAKIKRSVRFQDEVEISRLRQSMIAELFYASEDLAEFRYAAFMEEAGLNPEDFD